MRYFSIDTLGDPHDKQLVVLEGKPEGIGVKYGRLVEGRSIAADFPPHAVIHMSPARRGTRLGTLIGSLRNFLLLHREAKDVIVRAFEQAAPGAGIEYLPFTLVNPRGVPQSGDYFIINPLGTVDCLDIEQSHVEYFEGDVEVVLDVGQIVLAPEKLHGAPPLFRIRELPSTYVVSEPVAADLRAHGFTNLILTPLRQHRAAS